MKPKINIAIDGYSSCGKSTITKQLASKLGYTYIDSGAMYRAVTLYFLQHAIEIDNKVDVANALKHIQLEFRLNDGTNKLYLNGEDVEPAIRSMRVSSHVSEVAALSIVRSFLVKQQQLIAKDKGVVMDGRDIGTIVLPDAELKFFITADKDVRVERRYKELKAKGKKISKKEILNNLEHRDYIDTHRADSPLTKAKDAILIDNTHLTIPEQLELVISFVNKYNEAKNVQ